MAFERAYELDHHGKKDWFANCGQKSGLYAWVARADDYKMNSIYGEYLRKMGDVKTISELMEEEARRQDKLVSNLNNIIQRYRKFSQLPGITSRRFLLITKSSKRNWSLRKMSLSYGKLN
ncbi:hypothetical protein V8G54_018458 [Vigna mungo]|uniref:XS domain-containing protein n=1 Tax=Vigna mungo TaxID=3915 RepID=A0AAQ3N8S3_VIGMU